MDLILSPHIVSDIYNYLSWDTLKFYSTDDRFWKGRIDYLFPHRTTWWSSPHRHYLDPSSRIIYPGKEYYSWVMWAINGYLEFCNGRLYDLPYTLLNDIDFAIRGIKRNSWLLGYVGEKVSNCYDIVEAAVTKDGDMLQGASPRLQNNRNIVIRAITQSACAILFASDILKNDKEIALLAIRRNARAVQFISDGLCQDIDIIMETFKANCGLFIIHRMEDTLWNNQDIVSAAFNAGLCWIITRYNYENDTMMMAGTRIDGSRMHFGIFTNGQPISIVGSEKTYILPRIIRYLENIIHRIFVWGGYPDILSIKLINSALSYY